MHVITLFLAVTSLVHAQYHDERPCQRETSNLVLLKKDPITGGFSVVGSVDSAEIPKGSFLRNLVTEDLEDGAIPVDFVPEIIAARDHDDLAPSRYLEDNTTDIDSLYVVWECSCHAEWGYPTVYCPLVIDTCLRPSRRNLIGLPGCRNLVWGFNLRRYMVLLMLGWFSALVISLLTSSLGASLFGFFVSRFNRNWNERSVDRLMRRNPERARRMIEIFVVREYRAFEVAWERNRQQTNANANATTDQSQTATPANEEREPISQQPTSLVLHTRIYHDAPNSCRTCEYGDDCDDMNEMPPPRCTICYNTFMDGERVGALKCDHLFHVDCLRIWLQRRNVCPLCQRTEIAKPQYDEIPLTESSPTATDETPTTEGETFSNSNNASSSS